MDESKLIDGIKEAAREAGQIMKDAVRPKVMEKSGHANFVTETDERIQEFLIERLTKVLPEASFLGEEEGQDVYTEKMGHGLVFVKIRSMVRPISYTPTIRLWYPSDY